MLAVIPGWRAQPGLSGALPGVNHGAGFVHVTCQGDKLSEDYADVGNVMALALQCKKITTVGVFVSTRKTCSITTNANTGVNTGLRLFQTHRHSS